MNQIKTDFSIYPGLEKMFTESCRPFLDNITSQIIADQKINLRKLAITAYAASNVGVSGLVNACEYIASRIGSHIGKNLEVYSINLSGYNKLPCERHKLPWKDTLSYDYILFTDSFTDGLLLRHAHYVVSKQGVDDRKIKIAAVFYIPKICSNLEIDSCSLQDSILVEKRFSKKPDYVGQVINL